MAISLVHDYSYFPLNKVSLIEYGSLFSRLMYIVLGQAHIKQTRAFGVLEPEQTMLCRQGSLPGSLLTAY